MYFLQNLQLLQVNDAFIIERSRFNRKVLLSMWLVTRACIITISNTKKFMKRTNYFCGFEENDEGIWSYTCVVNHCTWGEMETCSGIETKESVALAVRVAIMKSAHGNCSIRSTSHEMELPIQKRWRWQMASADIFVTFRLICYELL